jgi:hypothetical protein
MKAAVMVNENVTNSLLIVAELTVPVILTLYAPTDAESDVTQETIMLENVIGDDA